MHPTTTQMYISNHLHHLGKCLHNYIEPCLNSFCDMYNLKNLGKESTCCKNPDNPSCIHLCITNRPKTFEFTTTIETFISDFHKLLVTVLKSFYKTQRPTIIYYRNYKNSENDNFRQDF